jgi:hypothetical protein
LINLSLPGMAAFGLGAIGFVLAWWLSQREPARAAAPASADTSYGAASWVRAIADAGYAVSSGLSRVHSGILPRYAFGSFIALAAIVLVRVSLR